MSLFACTGKRPTDLGISDSGLKACPSTPNCVSSDADNNDSHYIEAISFEAGDTEIWQRIKTVVTSLPRTRIITETENYIHVECSSAFFGFVDDLELHLRAEKNIIAVRSASRLGHSDFGVNRSRVETLRDKLDNRQ